MKWRDMGREISVCQGDESAVVQGTDRDAMMKGGGRVGEGEKGGRVEGETRGFCLV
jgi:hypothetical protein